MTASVQPEIYELLAQGLLYPGQDLRALVGARLAALGQGYPWAEKLMTGLAGQDLTELEAEHVRLFVNARDGARCLPYESVYHEGQVLGKAAEEVRMLYAAWGLEETGEMPDHAAVELAFAAHVARLCRGTQDTWQRIGMERELEAFEQKHLRSWLPDLAADIAAAACLPFYRDLALGLQQVFGSGQGRHDRGLAGDGADAASGSVSGDETL